ncbi:MAG TPA: RDD family protein [Dehalococcoidia bacterium]|nr:RDD family protein [Dehalococcoidia bacterium]
MTAGTETRTAGVRASLPRRMLAFTLDVLIMLLPLTLLTAVVASVLGAGGASVPDESQQTQLSDLLWVPAFLAILAAVFGTFWMLGRSPAMMLLGLRATRLDGGRAGPYQAASRGALTAAFLASALVLPVSGFSDPPAAGYNGLDYAIIWGSLAVFAASLLGYVCLLWDRTGQTLQDRLLRVKVVRA